MTWKEKLSSRKFWMCVAAFLSSLACSISGITSGNDKLALVGIICGVVASAIYAFCEAWADASAAVIVEESSEEEEEE